MANCSQTNNTTIIGTSAVSYDSTQLPCTDVKACDDLNTILTKFDNVICSAINSVNILSEEIINITEDLMIIGEEIENINNQIFICCPICDFTITATELPVCEFTVSANELPTCNFTGSVNQVPDPTTTTTSSSSTTTTSTTVPTGCTTFTIQAPSRGTHDVTYTNCYGGPGFSILEPGDPDDVICAIYPLLSDSNPELTIVGGVCVPPTTTTTSTSTTAAPTCMQYTMVAKDATPVAFSYFPCGGGIEINITLSTDGIPSAVVCCFPLTAPTYNPIHTDRFLDGPC